MREEFHVVWNVTKAYLLLAQVLAVQFALRRRDIVQRLLETRHVLGHKRNAEVEGRGLGRGALAHEALRHVFATLVHDEVASGGFSACKRNSGDQGKDETGCDHLACLKLKEEAGM
jgi:hypothetical protein